MVLRYTINKGPYTNYVDIFDPLRVDKHRDMKTLPPPSVSTYLSSQSPEFLLHIDEMPQLSNRNFNSKVMVVFWKYVMQIISKFYMHNNRIVIRKDRPMTFPSPHVDKRRHLVNTPSGLACLCIVCVL